MLVPLNIRNSIYEYLLNEGVMTAIEDVRPKCIHPASLVSRGYVKKRFAWRTFYWFLTNEGIDYLREVLHLPTEIVPATLNKPSIDSRFPGPRGPVGGPRMQTDGRSAYRIGAVGQVDATKEATVVPEGEVHFCGGPGGRPM
ncbi:40S ribosomal protein S10 [Taenia crassiceps]|uniref:40S ribosomal protein S10 n=1 Tax=Taenia crassiceps TaxID=6207 RepID=A0ABR4QPS3_9CEST